MPKKKPASTTTPIETSLEVLTEECSQLSDRELILMLLDRVIQMEEANQQMIADMPDWGTMTDEIESSIETIDSMEIKRKLDNLDYYLRNNNDK
jgi:hypothetical protein